MKIQAAILELDKGWFLLPLCFLHSLFFKGFMILQCRNVKFFADNISFDDFSSLENISQVNNMICIEKFSDFPQLGRFTLRTEGDKLISINFLIRLVLNPLPFPKHLMPNRM